MHTYKRTRIHWTIIALGVFLYGCSSLMPTPILTPVPTPSVEQMDKSFFMGIPCAAPCWQGLEVGKSSESDAIAVLPKLTFINQDTIQTYHSSMPNIDYSASAPGILVEANCANSSQQCLSLAIIDDVLTRIIVGLNYEIRPEEVIAYLGQPDYVGYDNLGAEKIMCEVYLVWTNSRLVLAARFEDSVGASNYCHVVRDKGKVPASLLLSEARYLSEAELHAKLNTGTGRFFEYSGVLSEQ